MSQKILTTLIAFGILVAFVGLMFMPAAVSGHNGGNDTLLGAGLAIFAFGSLAMSMGMYGKARLLRASIDADPNLQALLNGAKTKGNCDSCRAAAAVIQCTMHRVGLCTTCIAQHYDARACVYVPVSRRTANKGRAARAGR
jgi:hypothetical protein